MSHSNYFVLKEAYNKFEPYLFINSSTWAPRYGEKISPYSPSVALATKRLYPYLKGINDVYYPNTCCCGKLINKKIDGAFP